MHIREALRAFDWVLFSAAALLVMLGLAMLLSISSNDATILSPRFVRQLIAFAIATAVCFSVTLIPYHTLRRYALVLYMCGTAALILVAQFGNVIRGTTSRLVLAGIQVQPSEFMKVIIVIMLAWLFSHEEYRRPYLYLISGILVGLAAGLILFEPDTGMAALIISLWIATIIFLGVSWRTIAVLGLVAVIGFIASWLWLFADYQKERLRTFIDPARDPLGTGYNRTQSIIAFGSGELLGRGLGQGPQSQLNFLPEKHTDFMLASIGEQLGFVGIALVIGLYAVLLWRTLRIAYTTVEIFSQLLGVGAFVSILLSFFVSAGMNIGILPITGIPLPFVSYGGSNLVSTFLLLGIVQSVRVHSHWKQAPPREITHFS